MMKSAWAEAANTAEMPVAARVAQNNEPVMTPAASAKAGTRPSRIAVAMIAILLGPGLAVAIR